jgi:hypothetical protein
VFSCIRANPDAELIWSIHMGRMNDVKKLLIAGIVGVCLVAASGAMAGLTVGGKVWYADTDGAKDPALLAGPIASLGLGETFWVSGMFLLGSYDIEGLQEDVDSRDAEGVFGMSYKILDIGVGARYSVWSLPVPDGFGNQQTEDFIQWGPMVYAGLSDSFGESPIGWYVGGSYMFYDLGDARDLQDDYGDDVIDTFEHYNVEGGLFAHWTHASVTLGYRYKNYINYSDSAFQGPAASASFVF